MLCSSSQLYAVKCIHCQQQDFNSFNRSNYRVITTILLDLLNDIHLANHSFSLVAIDWKSVVSLFLCSLDRTNAFNIRLAIASLLMAEETRIYVRPNVFFRLKIVSIHRCFFLLIFTLIPLAKNVLRLNY